MAFSNRLRTLLLNALGLPESVDEIEDAIVPQTESLTFTFDGGVGAVVFEVSLIGNVVTLLIPEFSSASVSNAELTSPELLPAAYRPETDQAFVIQAINGSSYTAGICYVEADGSIIFYGANFANFNNASGIYSCGVTWIVP